MTRRIVQITTAVLPGDETTNVFPFALCDDGSVWEGSSGKWMLMPSIPQDEPADPIRKRLSPESEDTRALVLIKGVVDDCSLDVGESLRQIRSLLADVDPIGELETMGGRIIVHDGGESASLWWFIDAATQERIGYSADVASLRAAAARLLERIRGAK